VSREIVHDDGIAASERRDETLLNIWLASGEDRMLVRLKRLDR
jgi:hypothetical protein